MAIILREFASFAVLLMFMASMFLIYDPSEVMAAPTSDVRLYLEPSPDHLVTGAPDVSATEAVEIVQVGSWVDYELSFPLAGDLEISGASGGDIITLHLDGSAPTQLSSGVRVVFTLADSNTQGSERLLSSLTVDHGDLANVDFEMVLIDGIDTLEAGHKLILKMNVTSGSGGTIINPPGFRFLYENVDQYSYLALRADPLQEISLSVLQDGQPVDQVLPNGPDEARTVVLSAGARDSFGAYDVESINMTLYSLDGGIIYATPDSVPSVAGGQEWTYLNVTHTLPENLPEGDYELVANARSYTGQTISASMYLTVASGLYVKLEDPSTREVDAGDVVEFSVMVLNGGSSVDRIAFSADSDQDWSVQVPQETDIEGGEELSVMFRVTVPIEAPVSQSSEVTMMVDSRNADESYEIAGAIRVARAATFSLEVYGSDQATVLLGGSTGYELRLRNLENSSRTYELSVEDVPDRIDFEYEGEGVTPGTSYYSVNLDPRRSMLLNLTISVARDAEDGPHEIKAFARARGGTEKRFAYLGLNAVDDTKDILSSADGKVTGTAVRSGNSYPVTYRPVTFSLTLYNPGLDEAGFDVDTAPPQGWDVELSPPSIDLMPGTSATVTASVTPPPGEKYTPTQGITVTITASGPGGLGGEVALEVMVPLVTDVRLTYDGLSPITSKAGSDLGINLTVSNRGNRDETVTISASSSDLTQILIAPTSIVLAPGADGAVSVKATIPESGSDKVYDIEIRANPGGSAGQVDLQISAKGVKEGMDLDMVLLGVILGFIIILGAIVLVVYLRIGRKKTGTEPQQRPASAGRRPGKDRQVATKPLAPPPDEDLIRKADALSDSILDEREPRTVKDAKVVDATILE